MTNFTKEQIIKAGQIIKVLRLANSPGMDEVAIELNCDLTYEEEQQARLWADAFAITEKDQPLFEAAAELNERYRG